MTLLTAKLVLEADLARPMAQLAGRYMNRWAEGQGALPFTDRIAFRERLAGELQAHYARCVSCATGAEETDDLDAAALGLTHNARLRLRAQQQAAYILDAIERELEMAHRAAQVEIAAGIQAPLIKADNDDAVEVKDNPFLPAGLRGLGQAITRALGTAWSRFGKRLRGIVNVETETVSEEARYEAALQATANGAALVKTWRTMLDERVRPTHQDAEGQTVNAAMPFEVGGAFLRFPGDTSLGAPLKEIINCFPAGTRVSGSVLAATRHWYTGDLIEITTSGGHKLAGTPNHPVLTPKGWVKLGLLYKGEYVLGRPNAVGLKNATVARTQEPEGLNIQDVEPAIEQVFNSLARAGIVVRQPRLTVNFHGDRPAQDIDVVRADGVLETGFKPETGEQIRKLALALALFDQGHLLPPRLARFFDVGRWSAPAGAIRREHDGLALVGAGAREPQAIGLAARADRQAETGETAHDRWAREASGAGHGEDGHAGLVQAFEVVSVVQRRFSGHVFNLESTHGLYHANGLIAHNCRCSADYFTRAADGSLRPVTLPATAPVRRIPRDGAIEQPVAPTGVVALTGRTNAQVVLDDGSIVTLREVTPSTIVVSAGGSAIARANHAGGRVISLLIAPGSSGQGLDRLIRESVAQAWARNRQPQL